MNKKQLSALQEDWLAGNAVVAFVGALLTAQSWKLSKEGTEIFVIVTYMPIPACPDEVYLFVGALLLILSFALSVASLLSRLRNHAMRFSGFISMILAPIVLVAFIVGWLGAIAELPFNQQWTSVLALGGLLMLCFLGFRFVKGAPHIPPPTEDSSDGAGSE